MPECITEIDMGPLCVRAFVVPASIQDESRTVDVTWTTGAGVPRYDYRRGEMYLERLSLDPKHVDLARLNSGAPVLDGHSGYSVRMQFGVVVDGSARLEPGGGRATLRFSKRADVEPVWGDIKDGIVRNVSNGYVVYRYEESREPGIDMPIRTAVKWQPYEISMVPMPADAESQVRSGHLPLVHRCQIVAPASSLSLGDADRARVFRLAERRFFHEAYR